MVIMVLLNSLINPTFRNLFFQAGMTLAVILSSISFLVQANPISTVYDRPFIKDHTLSASLIDVLYRPVPLLSDTNITQLQKYYHQQKYTLLWSHLGGRYPFADHFFNVLINVSDEGLNPDDYHVPEIRQLDEYDPDDRVVMDLLLTDAFFKYSTHMATGRHHPKNMDPAWHIEPQSFDAEPVLLSLLNTGDIHTILKNLSPSHAGYAQLKQALKKYRKIERQGGWPIIPNGPSLKPGMTNERVLTLRLRLLVTGELEFSPAINEYEFEASLHEAVKVFQEKHGLEIDGLVGQETLQALNVPVQDRIEQIKLNMERWRWLPNNLGKRYLIVNMAGFQLQAVELGQIVLNMRAIVGKPYRATPAFRDTMTYLEYNPTWKVPPRIALEDLIPKQRQDPTFFQSQGIKVYSDWSEDAEELDPNTIDWNKITTHVPYKLQQEPGHLNSLGRIKFMFPNEFDVYLHDTPKKYLFDHHVRTFSSGCIRVEQPVLLAAYLQGDTSAAMLENIQTLIDEESTIKVPLQEKVPIYLVYWTAWTESNGMTHFRNDIYGRDRIMTEESLGLYKKNQDL